MTKNLILVFSILFFELNAQDYIDYYRKSMIYDMEYFNKSNSNIIDTLKEKKLLEQAIEVYNVTPDKQYFYSLRKDDLFFPLFLIDNKQQLAKYLSEYACLNSKGETVELIKKYIDYDKISFSDLVLSSYTSLINDKYKCVKPIDIKYRFNTDSFIDSLFKRDQQYRGKIKNAEKGIFNDSVNFQDLKSYLTNYGYPSFKDAKKRKEFLLVLNHIENFKRYTSIEKILYQAVLDGKLHPADYATAYDKSLIGSDLNPKYYWLIKGSLIEESYKPQSYNLTTVNEDRNKIGLPMYPLWTGKIRQ